MRRSTETWCLVLLVGLTACEKELSKPNGAVVSDSAGIRVVTNALSDSAQDPTWTVAGEPEVQIGARDGAPEYELFDVRSAVVLSNGAIVVVNGGTNELRFYDREGKYLRSAGGAGDGPGEFRDIESLERFRGDSLLAYDRRNIRVSAFGPEGRFARSFSLSRVTDKARPGLTGVLSSGAVVVQLSPPYVAGMAQTGTDRPSVTFMVSDSTGAARDTLGVFAGVEAFVLALPEDRWMAVRGVTFGPSLATAVSGERVAVAATDTFAVHVYGQDGSLQEIIRQRQVPVRIPPSDFTRYDDSVLATIESERSRQHYRAMFDLMPRHEVFPALSALRFDRAGNLWVEKYGQPGDDRGVWQVFDERGRFVARVEVPGDLRVLDIGADYVLGVVRDELGVEHLEMHALRKSGAA